MGSNSIKKEATKVIDSYKKKMELKNELERQKALKNWKKKNPNKNIEAFYLENNFFDEQSEFIKSSNSNSYSSNS